MDQGSPIGEDGRQAGTGRSSPLFLNADSAKPDHLFHGSVLTSRREGRVMCQGRVDAFLMRHLCIKPSEPFRGLRSCKQACGEQRGAERRQPASRGQPRWRWHAGGPGAGKLGARRPGSVVLELLRGAELEATGRKYMPLDRDLAGCLCDETVTFRVIVVLLRNCTLSRFKMVGEYGQFLANFGRRGGG